LIKKFSNTFTCGEERISLPAPQESNYFFQISQFLAGLVFRFVQGQALLQPSIRADSLIDHQILYSPEGSVKPDEKPPIYENGACSRTKAG
jgi:hypothetical protein